MMEQVITAIEAVKGSKKRRVLVNDEWKFSLYAGQVREHGLTEGMELTGALYQKICRETLLPQAKKRVLNLLLAKDRSEMELNKKLLKDGYPEEVCAAAVDYAKGYHYVDDLRYAATYLRSHQEEKSRLELTMKLKQKGIVGEVIEEAFEMVRTERMELLSDDFEEAEITALRRQVAKKVKDSASLSNKEISKLVASLGAKGFSVRDIRDVIGSVVEIGRAHV